MASDRELQLRQQLALVVGRTQRAISQTKFARFIPVKFQREWFDSKYLIRVIVAGNQAGKTSMGAIEVISACLGVRPISLGGIIPTPWPKDSLKGRKYLAAGESFNTICHKTILPKLREYLADDMIVRESKTGVFTTELHFITGAQLSLMSYEQDPKKFEGGNFDGSWFDEPPPQDIFQATRRGQMATHGWTIITATPLSEPWMLDDLIYPADNLDCLECSGGEVPHELIVKLQPNHGRVAAFTADMHQNCRQHGGGYLDHDEIYAFLDSIKDPVQRAAREFGTFIDFAALTFGYVRPETHVVQDFKVPGNWPLVEVVDPSPNRGLNIIWFTCDPEDRWIAVHAALIASDGGFSGMAQQILAERKAIGRHPEIAIMDPRGGHHKQVSSTTRDDWFDGFRTHGIDYQVGIGSSADNDGVHVLHDWLKPSFDPSKGADPIPRLRFCQALKDMKEGPLWAFERFTWHPGNSHKQKYGQKFKDWVDCAMMLALWVQKSQLTFSKLRDKMSGSQRGPSLAESYGSPMMRMNRGRTSRGAMFRGYAAREGWGPPPLPNSFRPTQRRS